VRSVELLAALILSKLAIVAVLELGGAALDQLGHHGLGGIMAGLSGTALLLVAGLSPWAVLRLVPMAELASGAVESLRASAAGNYQKADAERRGAEHKLVELAAGITARMRAEAQHTGLASPRADGGAAEIRRTREADAAEHNGARGRSRAAIEHLPDTGDGGEGERDGSSGSDGGERGGGVPEHVEERLPRLDPMFQAPNGSWRPLTLGPDGEWPHPQLWPPDAADGPPVQESHSRLEPLPPGDDHEPTPPAEDHDPLPAPQEKPEGPL
jgi:hypothetical protein